VQERINGWRLNKRLLNYAAVLISHGCSRPTSVSHASLPQPLHPRAFNNRSDDDINGQYHLQLMRRLLNCPSIRHQIWVLQLQDRHLLQRSFVSPTELQWIIVGLNKTKSANILRQVARKNCAAKICIISFFLFVDITLMFYAHKSHGNLAKCHSQNPYIFYTKLFSSIFSMLILYDLQQTWRSKRRGPIREFHSCVFREMSTFRRKDRERSKTLEWWERQKHTHTRTRTLQNTASLWKFNNTEIVNHRALGQACHERTETCTIHEQ